MTISCFALGGHTGYFGIRMGTIRPEPQNARRRPAPPAAASCRVFEKAEIETNPVEHDRLMTIVVVGGGPTAWNRRLLRRTHPHGHEPRFPAH